jgi:PilZ domain
MDSSAPGYIRDKRTTPRHDFKSNVFVRMWKSDHPQVNAESINLSERGIFFVAERAFQIGAAVEVFLQMPEEVTGEPPATWRCTGLVMHVQDIDSARQAVGVRFDCYEVARTESNCSSQTIIPPSRFGLEIEAAYAKASSHRR